MNAKDIIPYLKNTFIPAVYWTNYYNDDEVSFRDKPFMSDTFSFRIGAIRLRQLRVKPGILWRILSINFVTEMT